jgi:hypothetical protein
MRLKRGVLDGYKKQTQVYPYKFTQTIGLHQSETMNVGENLVFVVLCLSYCGIVHGCLLFIVLRDTTLLSGERQKISAAEDLISVLF